MSARRRSVLILAGVAAGSLLAAHDLLNARSLIPLAGASAWMIRVQAPKALRAAGVCMAAASAGAASLFLQTVGDEPLAALAREVPECVAEGVVLESRAGLGTFGEVETLTCERVDGPAKGVIVFEAEHAFSGSRFVVRGRLVPLGTSDFDQARSSAGAAALMTGHARFAQPPDRWRRTALALREGLVDAAHVLPHREGALLAGLTIGDTSRMSSVDAEVYRDTGLSHLVAVSGSNIAIVVGSILLIFGRTRLWVRLLAATTVLALYVTVVGPDASVLRAASMGVLALAALAFGRRHEVLSTLAYALAALLIVRPEMITSLGLQLSAAATAGLALWSGRLSVLFQRLPSPIAFPLAATLAAQIAVAPLLVHYFERLSVVGPLSNLVALPAVGASTLIGLGAGVLGTLWAPLGELGARLAYPFVWWIVRVADVSSAPSWSSVNVHAKLAVPIAIVLGVAAALVIRRTDADLVT